VRWQAQRDTALELTQPLHPAMITNRKRRRRFALPAYSKIVECAFRHGTII